MFVVQDWGHLGFGDERCGIAGWEDSGMARDSKIEWTHHTHNIVWGCTRVSPACQNCYAEAMAKRWGYDVWGPGERRTLSDSYWRQPLSWDAEARREGVRRRVFACSMCDVFEDHPTVAREREKLWALIARTTYLDWLLLTKRPENIARFCPWQDRWPPHVWAMATAESQEWLDRRWVAPGS